MLAPWGWSFVPVAQSWGILDTLSALETVASKLPPSIVRRNPRAKCSSVPAGGGQNRSSLDVRFEVNCRHTRSMRIRRLSTISQSPLSLQSGRHQISPFAEKASVCRMRVRGGLTKDELEWLQESHRFSAYARRNRWKGRRLMDRRNGRAIEHDRPGSRDHDHRQQRPVGSDGVL